jgi:hypothetical protein
MGFNVNDMVASLNKTGFAKTSHFEVFIQGGGDVGTERELTYRAESADIPGRSVASVEHKFQNYGPVNKVAYGQIYGDVTVQFIMSQDMREKEYFEIWQDKMVGTGAFSSNNGQANFNTKYFDDYAGTVEIRQYGSHGKLHSIHTLNEAYPLIINPVTMNWAEDGAAKLGVTFAYKNYKCLYTKQDQPEKGFGFSVRLGTGGISGSLNIPSLGSIVGASGLGGQINASVGNLNNRVASIRSALQF